MEINLNELSSSQHDFIDFVLLTIFNDFVASYWKVKTFWCSSSIHFNS